MEHTVIPPKRKARLTGKQAIREAPLRRAVLLFMKDWQGANRLV